MDRNTRRVVAAAFVVAASCNVYDPSLLVGGAGSSSGANGGTGTGGSSGKGGSSTGGSGGSSGSAAAGSSGTGGTSGKGNGGSSGASSGRGGTSGGSGGAGATSGTGGTDELGGMGAEGGEAGMGPTTGGASGTGGQGGTGGTGGAGAGGTAGTGGSSGAGTGGTGGAGAGSGGAGAGSGGTGGAATMSGCAKLTVPLNASTDQARFPISYSGATNLSAAGTTMTIVLYVANGNGGAIAPYVQDTSYNILRSATPLALSNTGWRTIVWNVSTEPVGTTGIVLTSILRIGLQIWANGATSGLVDPSNVFIDSIIVNTPSVSYPFATSGTVNTTPVSSNEGQPGVMWLNNYTEDTLPETLTGTALAWAATCP